MGLFLRQAGPRSELQSKVAADLQRKLRESSEGSEKPENIAPKNPPEPAFLENQHTTNAHGVIVFILIAALAILAILFVTKIIR